jgi:hypothetical protein
VVIYEFVMIEEIEKRRGADEMIKVPDQRGRERERESISREEKKRVAKSKPEGPGIVDNRR